MTRLGQTGVRLGAALISSAARRPDMLDRIESLQPIIRRAVQVVSEDLYCEQGWEAQGVDLSIVFGGDGSILRAARKMGNQQRPVLGVNLGRLGFLAHMMPENLEHGLAQIAAGQFDLVDHLMMKCTIIREGEILEQRIGLNELAIRASHPFSMQQIDLFVDQQVATSYNCDGLIVSTPIGSTAHNLSAGGPILRKDLKAFVISPISPHTLTVRPVVDAADRIYEMVMRGDLCAASAVLDGQVMTELRIGDCVRVERAESIFQMIEVAGHSYYLTLRDKLGWAGDLFRHQS